MNELYFLIINELNGFMVKWFVFKLNQPTQPEN
jgi:hypothetical protein